MIAVVVAIDTKGCTCNHAKCTCHDSQSIFELIASFIDIAIDIGFEIMAHYLRFGRPAQQQRRSKTIKPSKIQINFKKQYNQLCHFKRFKKFTVMFRN